MIVQTGKQQISLSNGFTVNAGAPAVTSVTPASGPRGHTLAGVMLPGAFAHFTQTPPVVTFSNAGITAAIQVTDTTHLTMTVTIVPHADTGASDVRVVTGMEIATGAGLVTVTPALPLVTSIMPTSGQPGQTLAEWSLLAPFTHFAQGTPVVTFSNPGLWRARCKSRATRI